MLYFSYGSFLDSETLKKHCPNAEFVCRAVLPNWELQFNFLSSSYRGGGVTGIEPAVAKLVRGVVYDVSETEMLRLDQIEGIPEGIYYRQTILVINDEGKALPVGTYRTTNPRGPYKPIKRYLALMIKGAREHKLDLDYINKLEAIDTAD